MERVVLRDRDVRPVLPNSDRRRRHNLVPDHDRRPQVRKIIPAANLLEAIRSHCGSFTGSALDCFRRPLAYHALRFGLHLTEPDSRIHAGDQHESDGANPLIFSAPEQPFRFVGSP